MRLIFRLTNKEGEMQMKKCVVVFKSRTQVMSFNDIMRQQGYQSKLVSTPKEAHIGCGISAEISKSNVGVALKIIKKAGFSSFHGIFLIERQGNRTSTTKI